jgi:DNA recombination protein RmuC
VGRSLNAAVGHYNQAVGSLESRVLVSARRFKDLSVTDDELPAPRQVESTSRSLGTTDGGGRLGPVELRSVDRRGAPGADSPGNTVAL